MNKHDWTYHANLIHKHGSAKFMRPTKRTLYESPPIERFDTDDVADIVIVVSCVAVLGIFFVLGVL